MLRCAKRINCEKMRFEVSNLLSLVNFVWGRTVGGMLDMFRKQVVGRCLLLVNFQRVTC